MASRGDEPRGRHDQERRSTLTELKTPTWTTVRRPAGADAIFKTDGMHVLRVQRGHQKVQITVETDAGSGDTPGLTVPDKPRQKSMTFIGRRAARPGGRPTRSPAMTPPSRHWLGIRGWIGARCGARSEPGRNGGPAAVIGSRVKTLGADEYILHREAPFVRKAGDLDRFPVVAAG